MTVKSCSVCNFTGDLRLCGGCKETYYCSQTCQKKDWEAHKVTCHEKNKQYQLKKVFGVYKKLLKTEQKLATMTEIATQTHSLPQSAPLYAQRAYKEFLKVGRRKAKAEMLEKEFLEKSQKSNLPT